MSMSEHNVAPWKNKVKVQRNSEYGKTAHLNLHMLTKEYQKKIKANNVLLNT